jgi:hypothetical protein
MFNALRSDELLVGVGRILRNVARTEGALEEYERSQVLSAYSVTRLLAAEQLATGALLMWTKESLDSALDGDPREALSNTRRRVRAAADGIELGDAICDLLGALPRGDPVRGRVHGVLAEMIDREVAALARPPR